MIYFIFLGKRLLGLKLKTNLSKIFASMSSKKAIQICYPHSINLYVQTGSETYTKIHSFICPLLFNSNHSIYNDEIIIYEELFDRMSSLATIKSKIWLIEVATVYDDCLYIKNNLDNGSKTVVLGNRHTIPLEFAYKVSNVSFLSIDIEFLESMFNIDTFQELHALNNIKEIITNINQDFIKNNNDYVQLENVLLNILNASKEFNINALSINNIKLNNEFCNRVVEIEDTLETSDRYLEKIQFKITCIENNHIKTATERRYSVKYLLLGNN